MILPVVASSALLAEQQEYYRLGRSLSGGGFPTREPYTVRQQLVSCYSFKTKKRRAGDSDRERETSQHTPNQAHVKHDLSTTGQSSLLHPHQEQAEPLHQPRRCANRVRLHGRSGP